MNMNNASWADFKEDDDYYTYLAILMKGITWKKIQFNSAVSWDKCKRM